MPDTFTPNYNLNKPQISGSPSTWGNKLNADMDIIDGAMKSNSMGAVPIGGVLEFAGATLPDNFKWCDGTIYTNTSIPLLAAVLNNKFGGVVGVSNAVPDFTNRSPRGASGTFPLGAVGGAASVSLNSTHMPLHNHVLTDPHHNHSITQSPHVHPDPGHAHGVSDPGHAHTVNAGLTPGVNAQAGSGFTDGATHSTTTNVSGISISGAFTGLQPASAIVTNVASGTGITIAASGNSIPTAVPTLSPFIAMSYIIRYQ